MYSIGGGAGSMVVLRTVCRGPSEPSSTARLAAANAASNRR